MATRSKYYSELSLAAQIDFDEIADWYEAHREGLGVEFSDSLSIAIDLIEKNPYGYSRQSNNTRRILMKRFPYAVYYCIKETSHKIDILAIVHTKRHPNIWKKRT